jgi:hypothetical protein
MTANVNKKLFGSYRFYIIVMAFNVSMILFTLLIGFADGISEIDIMGIMVQSAVLGFWVGRLVTKRAIEKTFSFRRSSEPQ